jgi:hypothetical protein
MAGAFPLPAFNLCALDFVDEGSRITKLLQVLQGMAMIVPSVTPFNLLHKATEYIEELLFTVTHSRAPVSYRNQHRAA